MSSEFEEYRVLKNREVEKLKPLLTPLRLRAHRLRGGVLALPRKLNLEALPGGVFSAGKRGYGEYTPKGIHLVHAQGVQYMCCLAHVSSLSSCVCFFSRPSLLRRLRRD